MEGQFMLKCLDILKARYYDMKPMSFGIQEDTL